MLQTIQIKLILLCVWAELAVLGSTKTLPQKYVFFGLFRCACKDCVNRFGNLDRLEEKGSDEDEPSYANRLTRVADADFYKNLGLTIIKRRWSKEETMLLFLLLNRQVSKEDNTPSNVARIRKRFNVIVNLQELSQHLLDKKSLGQIRGKIINMVKYVGMYNRKQ